MPDILTVTLNPAVDLATSVPEVIAGPKLRCAAPVIDPGGGGINVARVIGILGGRCTPLVALGGSMGEILRGLMQREGLEPVVLQAPGETRQSFAVSDATGAQFRFILPGPAWDKLGFNHALKTISAAAPEGGIVVLSGSMPPGVPKDALAQIAAGVQGAKARLVVDTSGTSLARLVASPQRPYLLRIDKSEAEAIAQRPLRTAREAAAFGDELIRAGVAEVVVIGRGREGSVLVSNDQHLSCTPPEVAVKSATGAGDSFLGAMVLSLARKEGFGTALRWGAAAAAAAVMTEATKLCTREDTQRLFAKCEVSEVWP